MRLQKYLSEVAFFDGKDKDHPSNTNSVIVFTKTARYELKGNTNGELSHAIKHLQEFYPVMPKVFSEMRKVIGDNEFYVIKYGQHLKGTSSDLTDSALINTLDYINDKLKNGEHLAEVEEKMIYILKAIQKKYDSVIDEIKQGAIDIESKSEEKIKEAFDKKKTIKFKFDRDGVPVTTYLNLATTAVAMEESGKFTTCFKIVKNNNGSSIDSFFSGRQKVRNATIKKYMRGM